MLEIKKGKQLAVFSAAIAEACEKGASCVEISTAGNAVVVDAMYATGGRYKFLTMRTMIGPRGATDFDMLLSLPE